MKLRKNIPSTIFAIPSKVLTGQFLFTKRSQEEADRTGGVKPLMRRSQRLALTNYNIARPTAVAEKCL